MLPEVENPLRRAFLRLRREQEISMESQLARAIVLGSSPIAVILTDEKPEGATQFKEGSRGCVGASIVSVAGGKTAVFDRQTYGCPGGGVGLGFGNCFAQAGFPIENLLSSGLPQAPEDSPMAKGERFFRDPGTVREWLTHVPITDVPSEYVVMKPLGEVSEAERPELVAFLVNADQLSALIVMTGFTRGDAEPPIAPFGGACQSILYGYAEAKRDLPRGVIGFFDIAQRRRVSRELLSYTVPWSLFLEMEAAVPESFLELEPWRKLQERQ
jgi:uncharacterized protein (DUF169 family)